MRRPRSAVSRITGPRHEGLSSAAGLGGQLSKADRLEAEGLDDCRQPAGNGDVVERDADPANAFEPDRETLGTAERRRVTTEDRRSLTMHSKLPGSRLISRPVDLVVSGEHALARARTRTSA